MSVLEFRVFGSWRNSQIVMARWLGHTISIISYGLFLVFSGYYLPTFVDTSELVSESWAPKAHWCTWGAKASPSGLIIQKSYCNSHYWKKGVRTMSSDPVYHGKYLTSMWTSKLDHIAMEEGCLDWWIAFSFRSGGWLGESVVPVWGRHGSKMHCGKKSRSAKAVLCSGQCSAERPWVQAFMRMLLWHVPPT